MNHHLIGFQGTVAAMAWYVKFFFGNMPINKQSVSYVYYTKKKSITVRNRTFLSMFCFTLHYFTVLYIHKDGNANQCDIHIYI